MSETPRTDNPETGYRSHYAEHEHNKELCRAVERELAAAKAENERLFAIIDGYKVAPDFLRLALAEVKRYTGTRDEAYVVAAADVFLDLLTARRALSGEGE